MDQHGSTTFETVASASRGDAGDASILLGLSTADRGGAACPQRDATGCPTGRTRDGYGATVRRARTANKLEMGEEDALTIFCDMTAMLEV